MLFPCQVLCDGELPHPCSNCGHPATVSGLITHYLSRGRASVTYACFGVTHYNCGEAHCSGEVVSRMRNTEIVPLAAAMMVQEKYGKQRCDNCDLVGKKRHRCSNCLIKLYCFEDYKVHKKVCRKEDVERKKKGKKGDRKEEGERDAENLKEEMVKDAEKVFRTSPDPTFQAVMNKVAENQGQINV